MIYLINKMSTKRIKELQAEIDSIKKKDKSWAKEMRNFQEGVSDVVIPYQKLTGYATAFILITIGLIIMIVTAAKGFSDKDLESHGYLIGGVILGAGFFLGLIVYAWTNILVNTANGKLINAIVFEKNLLR